MHTDKAIAEFEAWASSEAFGLSPAHFAKDEAGEYINYPTQCYWLVWQASRAELVIELPQPMKAPPYASYECGWNDMRGEATDAIEAAGVTVRGEE